jgi:outer membrane protein TolC
VDLAQAGRKVRRAHWSASKEVEDSLSAVATNRTRSEVLTDTVAQMREAYKLATVRCQAGMQDLLTVLDSQRSQLNAEDSLVQAQLARYSAAVSLFKALGGWSSAAQA